MGLRHTIAQTAGDIVSILRTRVELFGVEFNLEKSRLFRLIGLAAAAFIFLLLAVMVVLPFAAMMPLLATLPVALSV